MSCQCTDRDLTTMVGQCAEAIHSAHQMVRAHHPGVIHHAADPAPDKVPEEQVDQESAEEDPGLDPDEDLEAAV